MYFFLNKYKIIFNLLYKASEDEDKSSIFHKNCDRAQTTLILVETKKGKSNSSSFNVSEILNVNFPK